MQHVSRMLVPIQTANSLPMVRSAFRRGLAGSMIDTSGWVATIGLEIHAQLTSARTKLFSSASYSFAAPPNSQVEPFDAALPGTMPLLNKVCVESAIVAALGLNCRVNCVSRFERKHYFYADSPSGYQVTQQAQPIADGGWLEYLWAGGGRNAQTSRATIARIQLEQDTGKSLHDEINARSLIDLNRAGVGLIEVVTRPDFSSAAQAAAFVEELGCLLTHLHVCTADMSAGQMRVDCNISIGPDIYNQGSIVEVKNVNSLRAIRHAVDYEIKRQYEIIHRGETVMNETRSYDAINNKTMSMRDKEIVQDYRFLPEPNLPPLCLATECPSCNSQLEKKDGQLCVGCIKQAFAVTLSELPGEIRKKLVFEHLLSPEKAAILVTTPPLLRLYNDALLFNTSETIQPTRKETAYWCTGLLYSLYQQGGAEKLPSAKILAEFVALNLSHQLFGTGAENVLLLLCKLNDVTGPLNEFVRVNLPDCLLVADENIIHLACKNFVRDHAKEMAKLTSMKEKNKQKRQLRHLVHRLMTSPKYGGAKFSPALAEQLLFTEACSRPISNVDVLKKSRPPVDDV